MASAGEHPKEKVGCSASASAVHHKVPSYMRPIHSPKKKMGAGVRRQSSRSISSKLATSPIRRKKSSPNLLEDDQDGVAQTEDREETWDSTSAAMEERVEEELAKPMQRMNDLDLEDLDKSVGVPTVIYEGSKFFWRWNIKVDVNIIEESATPTRSFNRVVINCRNATDNVNYFPIYLNGTKLHKIITDRFEPSKLPVIKGRKHFTGKEKEMMYNQWVIKEKASFVLNRLALDESLLNKKSNAANGAPGINSAESFEKIFLLELSGDDLLGELVVAGPKENNFPHLVKKYSKSSYEDFSKATNELKKEYEELAKTVTRAASFSEAVSFSLDTFQDLYEDTKTIKQSNATSPRPVVRWNKSTRKVLLQNQVRETTAVLARSKAIFNAIPVMPKVMESETDEE